MKNAKRNVIVSAFMAIALCMSIVAGATFALFTSDSSVNIAITSGNVEVTATASDLTVYSPTSVNEDGIVNADNAVDENGGKFVNGGTATLTGSELKLDNMTPGDKATFKITVKNKSTVAIKYRTVIEAQDEGLFAGLAINIGGKNTVGATEWKKLEANAEISDAEKACVIELPVTAGSEYRNKKCTLKFTVEAKQGNAETPMEATRSTLNEDLTLDKIPMADGSETRRLPVSVTMGNVAAENISYSENNSGYTGQGVMLGSTKLNKYGTAPAGAGEYSFIFKDGTITSAATGYTSIDELKDTSVYMLVPGNSDVTFENMTFNGVVSFDIQLYTSPWSYLNSITFKNCIFNGIIVGSCPANAATFDGCTFNNYVNTTSANNSNPIWWRAGGGSWSGNVDEQPHSLQKFTFVNNTVTATRPVKIERIGWNCVAEITVLDNNFDISSQENDTVTKNMAFNFGQRDNTSKFILIDDGNTISANTASMYTAALGSGSNQYIAVSGSKVLDRNGNAKTITAMVWKTATGATFELKSID